MHTKHTTKPRPNLINCQCHSRFLSYVLFICRNGKSEPDAICIWNRSFCSVWIAKFLLDCHDGQNLLPFLELFRGVAYAAYALIW